MENLQTPVNVEVLDKLLEISNFDKNKRLFLTKGFREGFDLGYKGEENVKMTARNLKLNIGSQEELWSKVLKEVELGRYAGPFKEIPFDAYIQSPIGLVP